MLRDASLWWQVSQAREEFVFEQFSLSPRAGSVIGASILSAIQAFFSNAGKLLSVDLPLSLRTATLRLSDARKYHTLA